MEEKNTSSSDLSAEDLAYYENVRATEKQWVSDFIEKLPRLPKAEKEQMLALVPDIHVDTIGKINVLVQQSSHISKRNKDRFQAHLQGINWFNWKSGNEYISFHGHIYVQMTPSWLSDAALEAYYENAEPEERAEYETQKEMDKHPRKVDRLKKEGSTRLQEYHDALMKKYLRKFERLKKDQEESKQEETENDDLPKHASPKIELYEEPQNDTYYQYAMNFDENAGKDGTPLIIAEKVAPAPPKEKDILGENQPMEDSERLPALSFVTKQYMNNTKLGRILGTKQIDITEDEFDLNITEKVVNLVNIWSDDNITLTNTNISPFDMAVLDATYTIMQQGPMLITPEWIVRVMSGNNSKSAITQKKVNNVIESITKLQYIRIKIDCTEEYNAYQIRKGNKPVDHWGYESYLLPVGKIEARYDANGKRVVAYKLLEVPALYKYAEMNQQIVDVSADLLETQSEFSDTEEAVLIKRYVIKRVAQIVKPNHLNNNKISFLWYDKKENEERGLFPELGYKPDNTAAWRKKKQRINKIVSGTLKSLKEKKAITDYKEFRENGTTNPNAPIIGYQIFYDRKKTVLSSK